MLLLELIVVLLMIFIGLTTDHLMLYCMISCCCYIYQIYKILDDVPL